MARISFGSQRPGRHRGSTFVRPRQLDRSATKEEPLSGARVPQSVALTLLSNATVGGLTSVAVPVSLDSAGHSKGEIAVFFLVNAAAAIVYNTLLVPTVRHHGYPRSALVLTCAAVPVALLALRATAGTFVLVMLSGVLLLLVSTIVPQIFGRVAAQLSDDEQVAAVTRLRLMTVGGYILGLVIYSAVSALGLDPLLIASVFGGITMIGATCRPFAGRAFPREHDGGEVGTPRARSGAFFTALVLVALLKSADTLRGIYLPLFAVSSGLRPAEVPPLFLISALLELAALPLLGRLSAARGSAVTLVVIALFGVGSFSLLLLATTYPVLLLAQVLYAVVGVGFQSTGLVLLGRTSRGGVGAGASAYTAVTQVGTVLGAVLPLMVEGYSSGIFVIATVLVALAGMLAVALRAVGGRW
ncbi:hypothetical protein [Rathayibacter sp. AY1A7]|uniref:hypothetical protein n=1 Tax=Rathayibacter sp. AY1A7 TaxID=2080524 RepID=UPI0011B00D7D|nr:hypothetical protein [Rathayibacter sp. AY1A7]